MISRVCRRSKPSNGSSISNSGCGVSSASASINRRAYPFDSACTRLRKTGSRPTAETVSATRPSDRP